MHCSCVSKEGFFGTKKDTFSYNKPSVNIDESSIFLLVVICKFHIQPIGSSNIEKSDTTLKQAVMIKAT